MINLHAFEMQKKGDNENNNNNNNNKDIIAI